MKFTNIQADGQITNADPDALGDDFLISDYLRDRSYILGKCLQAIRALSLEPTTEFQILYGGVVSDAGSGQVNISEGAAIGQDADGDPKLIIIPSLSGVSIPSGWNDNRTIWVKGVYAYKLSSETRQHFNGETYNYILDDSYEGESDTDDLFTDSDPGSDIVKFGVFKMNGTTFSAQTGETVKLSLVKARFGTISGGIKFNSVGIPPKIESGNYEVDGKTINFDSDQTIATTDTILQSSQSLDSYCHYLTCINSLGAKKIIMYGEGAIAGATGTITSITGVGTTKTISVASGTFPANAFTRGAILVITGNDGVNGVFKVASYISGSSVTFNSLTGITGGASGTWTLYDRINTLHGAGSPTAIIVDADVVKYTPSLGENGWSPGIAAFDTAKNGFYVTIPGLEDYRVLGTFHTGAAGAISTSVFSYKSGRDKNDNSWLVVDSSAGIVTNAYRWSTISYMRGCDYISITNSGSVGSTWTIKRKLKGSAAFQSNNSSGGVGSILLGADTNSVSLGAANQICSETTSVASRPLAVLPYTDMFVNDVLKPLSNGTASVNDKFIGSLTI